MHDLTGRERDLYVSLRLLGNYGSILTRGRHKSICLVTSRGHTDCWEENGCESMVHRSREPVTRLSSSPGERNEESESKTVAVELQARAQVWGTLQGRLPGLEMGSAWKVKEKGWWCCISQRSQEGLRLIPNTFLKTLNKDLPYDLAILLQDTYPKELEERIQRLVYPFSRKYYSQ